MNRNIFKLYDYQSFKENNYHITAPALARNQSYILCGKKTVLVETLNGFNFNYKTDI